jgi:hypothetical protein
MTAKDTNTIEKQKSQRFHILDSAGALGEIKLMDCRQKLNNK